MFIYVALIIAFKFFQACTHCFLKIDKKIAVKPEGNNRKTIVKTSNVLKINFDNQQNQSTLKLLNAVKDTKTRSDLSDDDKDDLLGVALKMFARNSQKSHQVPTIH